MNKIFLLLTAFLAAQFALNGVARAGAVLEGDIADAMVTQSQVNPSFYDENMTFNIGELYSNDIGNMVEPFALPYLAPGQAVTAATITFHLTGFNPTVTNNISLYGLNRVSATSSAPSLSDWHTAATSDSANTLLDAKFAVPSTPVGPVTYSGTNLASFIQKQYTNSAFTSDLSATRWIFFRLTPDATQKVFENYMFATARNPNRALHPTLSLTISNGITNTAGRLQFSFNLPSTQVTSAGVYNPSTGALIRTLWNNVQYNAGTSYGAWDGKDDSGTAVASGSSYQIKLIYHNVQYVWDGTIGNTSLNQSGSQVYRSYGNIIDMVVADGNAYFTCGYNELQNAMHRFVLGKPQVPIQVKQNFSDPFSDFFFVAADATKTYWAKCAGGFTPSDTYVVAINNVDDSNYAFPKGVKPSGVNQSWTNCIDFDATAGQPNPASGLAVQQTGNDLFVAHGTQNTVKVFDKVQGTQLGSFSVSNPGKMAVTANGDVWVISNTTPPKIFRYTYSGGTATLKQTISGLVNPITLGVSADDKLLLVCDAGTSQQVKAFTNSTGAAAWTFGQLGGMVANGPAITTDCFAFGTRGFVAFQPDDSFWVCDYGNQRYLHYSLSGSTVTYIEQIAYVPASYMATVDCTDATRVYNTFYEYSVNYGVAAGGTNGSWKLVRNWQYGLPTDALHGYFGFTQGISSVATLPNGHVYALIENFATSKYDLLELPASGPARQTGCSFYYNPRLYPDGTLRFNISNTTNVAFYSEALTGFDSQNNPKWGPPSLVASSHIAATDPKTWNTFPERTEMTSSGVVLNYDPNEADTGYHLGGIPKGGTAWQWRSAPSTSSTYKGWFPQDGHFDISNGVQYAGNVAMAMGRNVVMGYHGEFWRGGEASQWLNFYDNGLMVGRFGTYGQDVHGQTTVDGFAGNSFSPTLVTASNGKTYIYMNDESNHGGSGRWVVNGWNAITEMKATTTIGGTTSLSSGSSGPSVFLTSPTAGTRYVNGTTVMVGAQADSSGVAITGVQFFDGSSSLGTVSAAPFAKTYTLSPGAHSITAVATDANGKSGTSAAVSVTVGDESTNTPPPVPVLATGTVAATSVPLTWSTPTTLTAGTSIGDTISYQCDDAGTSNTIGSTEVAGAPGYACSHFNPIGQLSTAGIVFTNPLDSSGTVVAGLGLDFQIQPSSSNGSLSSMTGNSKKLFYSQATTLINKATGFTVLFVPYAQYDLVVYSINMATNATLTVNDSITTTTVTQKFTKSPTTYVVGTVNPGSTTTFTDVNTVVFHNLTTGYFALQGGNIGAFQIVQRPYNQGSASSYSVQRATSGGTFAAIGTGTSSATSFTDSTAAAGKSYDYRVEAINSFGTVSSNTVSVTTPGSSSSSSGSSSSSSSGGTTGSTSTSTAGFSTWQAKYFTTSQLANASISGASADPYGSGVPNLLAYALQLDPATAQATDIPHATIVDGHLSLTYLQPASIKDITYIVEVSTDLTTWHSGTGYTEQTSSVSSTAGKTITIQETLPDSSNKHFMRLRVTQD